jgi:hypothetical protein
MLSSDHARRTQEKTMGDIIHPDISDQIYPHWLQPDRRDRGIAISAA